MPPNSEFTLKIHFKLFITLWRINNPKESIDIEKKRHITDLIVMKFDFKVLQYDYAFLVHQTAIRKLLTKLVLSYLRFCFELKAAASGLNEDTRRLGYCTVSFPACFVKYLNIISEIFNLNRHRKLLPIQINGNIFNSSKGIEHKKCSGE